MIELLQEILDAGKNTKIPLDMGEWHCGTACCLCGDVAEARNVNNITYKALEFSNELDAASIHVFGDDLVAGAIYRSTRKSRLLAAKYSHVFTEEELDHPHLTTDHNDRAIAHDFVRLVMRKCEEYKK